MLKSLLFAGGLVITTGPFCFMVSAQDYIDLEAEAAAREASGISGTGQPGAVPVDPYGAQPAQAYPATSYGVNSATSASGTPATTTTVAPPVAGAPSGGGLGNLFLQVQQLQQEVMRLNGKIEEQAHELRQLKEQSLQRYMDIDKRLSGGAAVPAAAPAPPAVAPAPSGGATTGGSAANEQPGEKVAYDAAYGLVVGRQFDQAVTAFESFLRDYPGGRYSPNAYYWLGELYLVVEPMDLESSRQSFAMLVSRYPEHPKAADSLYKLGKVQFMKGNREKSREYLDLVISQYANSNAAVVKLAKDFIAENNL